MNNDQTPPPFDPNAFIAKWRRICGLPDKSTREFLRAAGFRQRPPSDDTIAWHVKAAYRKRSARRFIFGKREIVGVGLQLWSLPRVREALHRTNAEHIRIMAHAGHAQIGRFQGKVETDKVVIDIIKVVGWFRVASVAHVRDEALSLAAEDVGRRWSVHTARHWGAPPSLYCFGPMV